MVIKGELRDFKQDIEINKDDLEGEWLEHPSLYLHYSEIYADAIYRRDKAKLKLDLVMAKLDLAIRKDPHKYDFNSKPTEGGIKNTIMIQEEYIKAQEELNKKTKVLNSFSGVKTAFEHKKHSLSNLVALKIGGFYSEPKNVVKDIKKLESLKGQKERKQQLNENRKIKESKQLA